MTHRSFFEGSGAPRLPLIKVTDSSSGNSNSRLPLVGMNRMSLRERDPSPTGGTKAQSQPGTYRNDPFMRPTLNTEAVEPSSSGSKPSGFLPTPKGANDSQRQRPPPTPSSNIWMTSPAIDEDEAPTALLGASHLFTPPHTLSLHVSN